MTDHAVIVPTSAGPVGGVVSEPEGGARAALMLLHGGGHRGRAGVNAVWTRIARCLAELGVVVLRVDYARDAESFMAGPPSGENGLKRVVDRRIVIEAAGWFGERSGVPRLFVVGSCYGGRLAIKLAEVNSATTELLLVVPYLRPPSERSSWRERRLRAKRGEPPDPDAAQQPDPALLTELHAIAGRASVWILLGDRDPMDAFEVKRRLAGRASIQIDVVPGMALYPVHYPDVQAEVRRRLIARIEQVLG